jgi:hypothetical protein
MIEDRVTGQKLSSQLAESATSLVGLGADPTGVNSVSTILNNALANGKRILAVGTFLIDSQINVTQTGVKIFGIKGKTKFIQKNGSDFAQGLFNVNGTTDIVIEDIELIGDGRTLYQTAMNDGIRVTGSSRVLIKNVYVHGFIGDGIRVTGNSDTVTIEHPICNNNQQTGIHVNDSTSVSIFNSRCDNNGQTVHEHGIYISGINGNGSEKLIVNGHRATNNVGSGLQINEVSCNMDLDNILCWGNQTNGVNITTGSAAHEVSCSIGTIKCFNNALDGFYLTGNYVGGNVDSKLSASNLVAVGNGRHGLDLVQLRDANIAVVTARENGQHGIYFAGSAGSQTRNNLIASAVICDNSQSTHNTYSGVRFENAAKNVIGLISMRNANTTLTNKQKYGIEVVDNGDVSTLNKIGLGDITGNATSDFSDISVAKSTRVLCALSDGSYPTDAKSTLQSAVFTFTSTETTIVQSVETYQPGRYFVYASGRVYNGAGSGTVKLYLGSSVVQNSGQIDVTTNRQSVSVQGVVSITSNSQVKLTGTLVSGTMAANDFQISIMRI